MLRTELDAIPLSELLEMPVDTVVDEGFARDFWKPVWLTAAEQWFEDGSAWYDYACNGFKGWNERTDFEVYCDLRCTFIEDSGVYEGLGEILRQAMLGQKWASLTINCAEIGKYS